MARKKIVFIIVEGPSDDEALGILFERIFDKNTVFVHIEHGDITSQYDSHKCNILSKIGAIINSYAKSNHFSKKDFKNIIHLVDMDGAYVPDDSIVEDDSINHIIYSVSEIKTKNKQYLVDHNSRKRGCIDKLSKTDSVCGIPYQAYYMSSNLDHVLYNKLNLTDTEKEHYSFLFAQKYKDDIEGFKRFMGQSDFSVNHEYIQSWDFIKNGKNSLNRYSNLCICLDRALQN